MNWHLAIAISGARLGPGPDGGQGQRGANANLPWREGFGWLCGLGGGLGSAGRKSRGGSLGGWSWGFRGAKGEENGDSLGKSRFSGRFTDPDCSNPGQDCSNPTQDCSFPGQDWNDPGRDSSIPGRDGSVPGWDRLNPGVDSSAPGQDGSVPGQEGGRAGLVLGAVFAGRAFCLPCHDSLVPPGEECCFSQQPAGAIALRQRAAGRRLPNARPSGRARAGIAR